MKSDPGVYGLIMPIESDLSVSIGAMGNCRFPAGWYLYMGSAHGAGGLRKRTDRHRQDEKRHHWHVDHLRDHVPIEEIWFSHDIPFREHDWAWTLFGMHGATVPVPGFGARDCKAGCSAHLIRFPYRPNLCAFRHVVNSQWPDHRPIFTEFVADGRSALEIGDERKIPWLSEYLVGRRYLELRRRAGYDGVGTSALPDSLVKFSKDTIGKRILSELAVATEYEVGNGVASLTEAAKFADAVETIISQCGPVAHRVIFDAKRPQQRNAILMASRKSRERQKERVEKVLNGTARSIGPQRGDAAPDSMDFGKLYSRLGRACGLVECCLRGVERHANDITLDVANAVVAGAASFRSQLGQLSRLVYGLDLRPGTAAIRSVERSKRAVSLNRINKDMSSALGLLAKNVRDVPRSSYDLRPTRNQLEAIKTRIAEGIDACDRLCNLCNSPPAPRSA